MKKTTILLNSKGEILLRAQDGSEKTFPSFFNFLHFCMRRINMHFKCNALEDIDYDDVEDTIQTLLSTTH